MKRVSIAAVVATLALAACSNGSSVFAPGASGGPAPAATTKPTTAPTATPTNAPTATPTASVGGPVLGTPTFAGGGSGTCASGLVFTGASQTATIPITDSGYTGAFTATNTAPTVATVAISGATVVVTAVSAGQTYFTVSDSFGNQSACNVGVTTSMGTVQ